MKRRRMPLIALAASGATLLTFGAGVLGAAPAGAAQSVQTLECDGHPLTVRTNDNSSENGGWGAAQIESGDGHLIPVSFSFSAYDETTQQQLFSFTAPKGNGNANHNQQTITCTQTETGTLADLLEPGEQPPPGVSLDDVVTSTFTAEAVLKS